jgi:orotate phosphoribosyltransferase
VKDDLFSAVPARRGHFLLESGYHTDLWLTLDAVFLEPRTVAPLVSALAEKLRPHAVSAVCGPLLGGAFLAQGLAGLLDTRFYYAEPAPRRREQGLFKAEYRIPPDLARRLRGERVAVVDDAISAGSSIRATIAALASAGASIAAIGTFQVLGDAGLAHFAAQRIPVETLGHRAFHLWKPLECPLCAAGEPLEGLLQ